MNIPFLIHMRPGRLEMWWVVSYECVTSHMNDSYHTHTHTLSLSLCTTIHDVLEMFRRIYNCVMSHMNDSYHTHTLSRDTPRCTRNVLWHTWIRARRRTDFKYLHLQIGRFSRPLFWVTGTPFYFREKLFEFFLTSAKTCLKVTGTLAKTCWNLGSRNYFLDLISSVCGSHVTIDVYHTHSFTHSFSLRDAPRSILYILSHIWLCHVSCQWLVSHTPTSHTTHHGLLEIFCDIYEWVMSHTNNVKHAHTLSRRHPTMYSCHI